MTAMFALFLVLWLVNQSSDVKSAIAGYFQDPLGRADEYGSSIMPGRGRAGLDGPRRSNQADVIDLRRDRLQTLAERTREAARRGARARRRSGKYVEIQLTDDGLRIQLLEDSTGVFFETGSAGAERARARDPRAARRASSGRCRTRCGSRATPTPAPTAGSSSYTNWELSADRANAARRILTAATASGPPRLSQIRGLADRELRDPAIPYAAEQPPHHHHHAARLRAPAGHALSGRPAARFRAGPPAAADAEPGVSGTATVLLASADVALAGALPRGTRAGTRGPPP